MPFYDDATGADSAALDAPGASGDSAESHPLHEVGVGPWPGGPQVWPRVGSGPDAPLDERYDPELLADGDRRNVADHFRYWKLEAIVAELDTRRHSFHVAIENWGHDFNIGSVVRTANAFAAGTVHIVGRRRWNKRGAMVTDRYQHVLHHPEVDDLLEWAAERRLPILGIDNVPGSIPIEGYKFPRDCILLFGQEGPGLSMRAREASRDILHMTQFGSTRSINAGAAGAIAMHAWIQQHAVIEQPT